MLIEKVNSLPEQPGVYLFKTKNGKILYVGKAKNLKKRVKQYFQKDIGLWKEEMLNRAYDIDFIITETEEEALLLENNLIKKYQPPFNSLLKGDTGYVYIRFGWSEKCKNCKYFPKIEFTRYKDKPGIYIGPKPRKKDLKKLLQTLRLILKFRTCSDTLFKKGQVCSDYIFGICEGRCLLKNEKNTEEYKNKIKKYQQIVNIIIDFFKGKTDNIEKIILNEINKAIKQQNFERAAKLRDIYFSIKKLTESQNVVLDSSINGYFYLAKKINNYILVVICYFYNGKLIDIIKYKERINENDNRTEYIIHQIENEFPNVHFEHKIKNNEIYGGPLNEIDLLPNIKDFLEKQIESLIISSSFERENILNILLNNIKNKLGLKNYPYKIEALDISHLGGSRTSGGLVCMIGGIKYKKGYRKYKIKTETNGDDYKALEEVIIRRFKLNDTKVDINDLTLPDLFIIDGGKGQLNIIIKLLNKFIRMKDILKKVDFISIGKGEARYRKNKLSGEEEKIYVLNNIKNKIYIKEINSSQLDPEEFKILTKARDEAHRFANKYREEQMIKKYN